jgi:putative oxidoreductase
VNTASTISRYLLAIMFLVFGVNGFIKFVPTPPIGPIGLQFYGALAASHYVVVIFGLQLIFGILLLMNRYVPLTLILLAPIIVNIFFFHALMAPNGLPAPIFLIILWTIVALRNRLAYDGLLQQSGTA